MLVNGEKRREEKVCVRSAQLCAKLTSIHWFPSEHKTFVRSISACTMLDQRERRWAGVVQMLYKCFVFAGFNLNSTRGLILILRL